MTADTERIAELKKARPSWKCPQDILISKADFVWLISLAERGLKAEGALAKLYPYGDDYPHCAVCRVVLNESRVPGNHSPSCIWRQAMERTGGKKCSYCGKQSGGNCHGVDDC
jgi:hypothetical protein